MKSRSYAIINQGAAPPNTVDLKPPAARGSFEKPPLDPVKLFIIKFFRLKSTTLAALLQKFWEVQKGGGAPSPSTKGFLAAGGSKQYAA